MPEGETQRQHRPHAVLMKAGKAAVYTSGYGTSTTILMTLRLQEKWVRGTQQHAN